MGESFSFSVPDRRLIADLRSTIERLEEAPGLVDPQRPGAPDAFSDRVPLGVAAVDNALRGGLRRNGLHEVAAADESAAATGFCAAVLARLAGTHGTVVWCQHTTGLYGPGLAGLGLDPARLIVVRARNETDLLWAMEEGLRSRAPAAVLGETAGGGPIGLRRLQLAAETGGVSAILLRPAGVPLVPGPTLTRWRVASAPAFAAMPAEVAESEPDTSGWANPLRPRWRVELQRCRGGVPASWHLEWCDETGGFVVAPEFRHRPARPSTAAREPCVAVQAAV